jgi:hypothetical protein
VTEVVVTYTVYANDLTVRTNHVDDTHAFLHGPATFVYPPGLRSSPIEVRLSAPADWTVTTAMAWSGNAAIASYGNAVLFGMLLLIVIDMLRLRFKLRRELTSRFPDEPLKGTTYYAVMRSLQMKFMRLPKSQVRIGQRLPEHYR